jgi:hypothetical protein
MSGTKRSYYARNGGRAADLLTLLHVPYTLWHLSYVVIGAALAPDVDAVILAGTVLAFAFGLGVGAHALDEVLDRPLATGLSDRLLWVLGWGGLAAGGALAVAAAWVISPVALVWGGIGVVAAAAYSLEWSPWLHSTIGFGIAWGAFPVLVGYWAQTESVSIGAVGVAAAATVLAMAQRTLSTPARHVRRRATGASASVGEETWDATTLVATWERPLRLLVWAHVLLAAGLLAVRVVG